MTKNRSPKDIDIQVGSNIRALRKKLGLSLIELAEILELSYQQLQKYEIGANRISTGTLVQLADALNVSPGYLIEMPHAQNSDSYEIGRIKQQCQRDLKSIFDEQSLRAASILLSALVANQNNINAQ
ncbi:MAG: helix-turn-helix domain-containing protein [Hyphomonas sp.]